MVAQGYENERVTILTLGTLCALISFLQIYVCTQKIPLSLFRKRRIHCSCLLALLCMILNSIDTQGVFNILPYPLVVLFGEWMFIGLSCALCVIIYSHFQVHYETVHKEVPTNLVYLLIGSMIYFALTGNIFSMLEVGLQKVMFSALKTLSTIIFILILGGTDLYGYLIVWKIFREPHTYATVEKGSLKNKPSNKTMNEYRHDAVPNRSLFFRVILQSLIFMFLIAQLSLLPETIKNAFNPPRRPDPLVYKINTNSLTVLVCSLLETWWGWEPLEGVIYGSPSTVDASSSATHPDFPSPFRIGHSYHSPRVSEPSSSQELSPLEGHIEISNPSQPGDNPESELESRGRVSIDSRRGSEGAYVV